MTPADLKAELLTKPEQIAEYFSIVLEAAIELASQGKLTSEQLRAYRKEFSKKELADINSELAALQ